MTLTQFKKVKTIQDIINDPRIQEFIKNYDGHGIHYAACNTGYNFEGERTIAIGNIEKICNAINNYLEADIDNGYNQ